MNTRIIYLASALSIAGAVAITGVSVGHADAEAQKSTPQNSLSKDKLSKDKAPSTITPSDSSAKEKLTDATFVEKAALNSMGNIELSKLALQKSQNKKIKKFASKIVGGSNKAMGNLKNVASTYRLEVPQRLSGEQRETLDQMQQLNGREFDIAYVDVMQKAQGNTVGLYDNAAGQASLNAELRVFASKELPGLRKNQEIVHALTQTAPSSAATNSKSKKAVEG